MGANAFMSNPMRYFSNTDAFFVVVHLQFLQRDSPAAGPCVSGCGHSLHHLRGSGEGPE